MLRQEWIGKFHVDQYERMEVPLNRLPETAQKATVRYMAVDGTAWRRGGDPHPVVHFQEYVDSYPDHWMGYLTVPTADVIASVMEDPAVRQRFACWADYHAAWIKGLHVVRFGNLDQHQIVRNAWPCILSPTRTETFMDGWHRFHAHVELGRAVTNLLYFIS
jgi:hypothetical protein